MQAQFARSLPRTTTHLPCSTTANQSRSRSSAMLLLHFRPATASIAPPPRTPPLRERHHLARLSTTRFAVADPLLLTPSRRRSKYGVNKQHEAFKATWSMIPCWRPAGLKHLAFSVLTWEGDVGQGLINLQMEKWISKLCLIAYFSFAACVLYCYLFQDIVGGYLILSPCNQEKILRRDAKMVCCTLLALEERMGTVTTVLTEEALSKCLKRSIYQSTPSDDAYESCNEDKDDIKCCICQEEYDVGLTAQHLLLALFGPELVKDFLQCIAVIFYLL